MSSTNENHGIVALVESAHALYCRLTGQNLLLRFDRQRRWYELLRAGFNERDVERVVKYLQREVRIGRRNPGALKLSNLLEPDRFEEDLNLSRIRLEVWQSAPKAPPTPSDPPAVTDEIRLRRCETLRRLRRQIQAPDFGSSPENHGAGTDNPTTQSDF